MFRQGLMPGKIYAFKEVETFELSARGCWSIRLMRSAMPCMYRFRSGRRSAPCAHRKRGRSNQSSWLWRSAVMRSVWRTPCCAATVSGSMFRSRHQFPYSCYMMRSVKESLAQVHFRSSKLFRRARQGASHGPSLRNVHQVVHIGGQHSRAYVGEFPSAFRGNFLRRWLSWSVWRRRMKRKHPFQGFRRAQFISKHGRP